MLVCGHDQGARAGQAPLLVPQPLCNYAGWCCSSSGRAPGAPGDVGLWLGHLGPQNAPAPPHPDSWDRAPLTPSQRPGVMCVQLSYAHRGALHHGVEAPFRCPWVDPNSRLACTTLASAATGWHMPTHGA